MPSASISPTPPPSVPQRPARRPAPRRVHTFLFWAVFLLFFAALCYLGLLAVTGDTGRLISRTVVDSHRVAECLVALCTVAALAGAVATRYHLH